MKTRIALLSILLFANACSSVPKTSIDLSKIGEEEVLKTYGKDDIKHSDQFKVENHLVVATGMSTISADNGRPEAAIKIAQASAKGIVAGTIESKLERFLQVASENSSQDSQEMRELISEVSKLTTNELKLGKTYYEKVKVYASNGIPSLEYRAWAEVSMTEEQMKRHIIDSIRKQSGRMGMSEEFHKSVSQNWDKMLSKDDKPAEERKPASVEIKPAVEAVKQAVN